jgi:hypothetical protein
MKKLIGMVAGLALVASASADVRFYFTSSATGAGLTDSSLALKNTDGSGTDGATYALTDVDPAVADPSIDPSAGEWLYLWVAFENEPNARKIQGINLSIDMDGNETGRGIYLGDDTNGDEAGSIRWNLGSRTTDDMVLVAIQEPGVVNRSTDRWLYDGSTRTGLLGGVQFKFGDAGPYEVRLGLDRQGVSYSGQASPKVKLGKSDEQFDGAVQPEGTPTRWSTDADAFVAGVPEPASLLLLALAGLAIRRR